MKNPLRRRECGDITINSKHTKCICLFFSGSTGWKMTKRSKKEERLIITPSLRAPTRDPRSASLRQSDLSVSWVGLCFRVGMFCSCTKRACGCFVICDALFCCSSLRGNFSFVLGMGRMVTKSSRTEFYICGREGRFFLFLTDIRMRRCLSKRQGMEKHNKERKLTSWTEREVCAL